jgi:RNA polymerase sigma factor (sigma-70 family)
MGERATRVGVAYRAHIGEIRAFLQSRTGCRETAEDLAQEVYLRLYGAIDLAAVQDLKSYLYRIAGNLLIDHYRSVSRKTAPAELRELSDEADLVYDAPTAEDMLLLRDEIRQVATSIGEMSSLCQNIFWLSKAQGFRNNEIASMLGVCLSTVEKNLSRATKRCESRAAA